MLEKKPSIIPEEIIVEIREGILAGVSTGIPREILKGITGEIFETLEQSQQGFLVEPHKALLEEIQEDFPSNSSREYTGSASGCDSPRNFSKDCSRNRPSNFVRNSCQDSSCATPKDFQKNLLAFPRLISVRGPSGVPLEMTLLNCASVISTAIYEGLCCKFPG